MAKVPHVRELVLSYRRQCLLKAIHADELYQMRVRIDGEWLNDKWPGGCKGGRMGSDIVRVHIFDNWDRYAEELKRWCDSTITGELTRK